MCGIVGYVGKEEALPILITGLKNLEYRGYDSAGIVVLKGKKIYFKKTAGRVFDLENKIGVQGKRFKGIVGIAHTRWATHGGVSDKNAHPHFDCRKNIYLVHNGIVENYGELKSRLIKKGHRFSSETDTEVLAHLIEENRKQKNVSLEDAVRLALVKVRGTYGLAVLDRREPYKIVAARNFSPLLLGLGNGELVVASDATAILSTTKNVVHLKDGEVAVLTPEGHRILKGDKLVRRDAEKLDWDMGMAEKGGYPHFMLKEIFEGPEAVRNSIRGRLIREEGKAVLGGLREVENELRKIKKLIISACGTAYLAGRVGEYMLEEYGGIPTEVDLASEFRYRKPIFEKGDAFLVVSQSGETADTLASLREAKEKGILSLGIVNVVGSTISRETDAGVYQHIGPEIGVAATKSFISQVVIMALLTLFLGRKRGLSLVVGRRIAEELQRMPGLMEKVLKQSGKIKKIANKYLDYDNFFFLGRKYNYPVVLEGALKLKEVSYVHAEGYSAGEMKHGPIALIDRNFPTVAIAIQDSVYDKMISNIEEIKARRGRVLAIATEGDEKIKGLADEVIYIPKTLEMLSPILSVIPLHLFAYYFGVGRGLDVDKPRNLAKSVTVE